MTRSLTIFLGAISALALLSARALATPPDPTQVVFSQVQATTITVDWQGTTGTTIQFYVELSSSAFVTPLSSATDVLSSTFTGLDVNTQYFTHVQSSDTVDGSTSAFVPNPSTSVYTLANAPVNFSTTSVSAAEVTLAWNENGNPTGTLYSLERSTDGATYGVIATQTGSTYDDITVQPGLSYVYRMQALNGDNIPTAYSNTTQATITGVAVVPMQPTGLSVARADAGGGNFQLTIRWHAVTERTDGSALSNLAGYQIYTSASLLTPRALWTPVTTVTTESYSTTTANASAVNYYSVRAVDTNSMVSDWTEIMDDTSGMNHFFMASDNVSRVQLPETAATVLSFEHNTYGSDLTIGLAAQTSEETGRIIRSMRITVTNITSGSAVTDLLFDPPILRTTLGYTVQNGNVVAGAPEPAAFFHTSRTPVVSAASAADELSLFWFNGVEWVKTTGIVNTSDNTVSFTGSHMGSFQLRAATHGVGSTLTKVYPRIISPNGDGWNDKAIFLFDNPELLPLSGKIYDISGALVIELAPGPIPDSSLEWDGKDATGIPVPGGIYMYQLSGGTAQSGTVVVAR